MAKDGGGDDPRESSEGNGDPGPIPGLIWAGLVINLFLQPSKCGLFQFKYFNLSFAVE